MELVPSETLDPTPFLYDSTCYAAAILMGVGMISNLLIKPIDVKATLKQLKKEGKLKDEDKLKEEGKGMTPFYDDYDVDDDDNDADDDDD